MIETEFATYRKLQKHLNKMPVGFPPTKSGVELNILQKIFTPKEAGIVLHLDYKHRSVDEIYKTAKEEIGSREELVETLDAVVAKGGIFRRERDGKKEYAVIPLVLWGIYEHQVKRLDPDFLNDVGQYLMGEFGLEMATHKLPKMRVIPIEESIQVEHNITTYDELKNLIEQSGDHIAVQECVCRKVNDMQGKSCKATDRREVCMSIGDLADLYVQEGWARKLTRDEALVLARMNEEEGLVLMPANQQEPSFICACCSDCCGMLGMIRNFPKPAEVVGSNYYAEVDETLCKACKTCIERCPIEAVRVNGHASVDLKRCIGCGLCVPTCKENAMHLISKKTEVIPPKTEAELFDTILEQKSTFTGKVRNSLLKTFLRVVTRIAN